MSTHSNSSRRSTIVDTANLNPTNRVEECPVIADAYYSEPSLAALDVSTVTVVPSLPTSTVQEVDDIPVSFSTDSTASDEESDSGVMMMNSE